MSRLRYFLKLEIVISIDNLFVLGNTFFPFTNNICFIFLCISLDASHQQYAASLSKNNAEIPQNNGFQPRPQGPSQSTQYQNRPYPQQSHPQQAHPQQPNTQQPHTQQPHTRQPQPQEPQLQQPQSQRTSNTPPPEQNLLYGSDLSQVDKDFIFEGLKKLYKKKVLPLEIASKYSHFSTPPLGPSDFEAKPMVVILGQYSVGKTSFIRSLLKKDFPGQRIGPEPTTDRFTAIMHSPEGQGTKQTICK